MFCNVIVEIHHSAPIESRLYIQALVEIEQNVREGYRAFLLDKAKNTKGDTRDFYAKPIEIFDEDQTSWLWIETTASGSGVAKGKGRNPINWLSTGAQEA